MSSKTIEVELRPCFEGMLVEIFEEGRLKVKSEVGCISTALRYCVFIALNGKVPDMEDEENIEEIPMPKEQSSSIALLLYNLHRELYKVASLDYDHEVEMDCIFKFTYR